MSSIIDHFLFYADNIHDDTIILDKDETNHALAVLRIVIGDSIFITDGKGTIYFCEYSTIQSDVCVAKILKTKKQKLQAPDVHVFVGLTEKDSFETLLTSLVPLGVVSITPVQCQYCQKNWWKKKWEKNSIRFQKKMITAAKQSWNAWIPLLSVPMSFDSAISMDHDLLLVADENGELLSSLNSTMLKSRNKISCFVGPPGGFSFEELSKLNKSGSFSVKISPHRLRTELASTVLVGNIVQMITTY